MFGVENNIRLIFFNSYESIIEYFLKELAEGFSQKRDKLRQMAHWQMHKDIIGILRVFKNETKSNSEKRTPRNSCLNLVKKEESKTNDL